MFVTAVAASYDENYPSTCPDWESGFSNDYAIVIAAFLTAVAVEDRCDENDLDESMFSPLRKIVRNLPQLIVLEESIGPFVSMHARALSMLFRYENREERRHDLAALKKRIAESES